MMRDYFQWEGHKLCAAPEASKLEKLPSALGIYVHATQYFLPLLKSCHVLVKTTNITAVAYINHQGSTRLWFAQAGSQPDYVEQQTPPGVRRSVHITWKCTMFAVLFAKKQVPTLLSTIGPEQGEGEQLKQDLQTLQSPFSVTVSNRTVHWQNYDMYILLQVNSI